MTNVSTESSYNSAFDLDDVSNRLKNEISSANPNVDIIRKLLLQGGTPRSGQRSKMWRILLLGSNEKLPVADKLWKEGHNALGSLSANEEHVLNMDVPRTRGEIAIFKLKENQESISNLLTRWCLSHGTRYRQGLNEVLAPFIALEEDIEEDFDENDPKTKQIDEREMYSLFDAFVCKFLAAFYIDGNNTTVINDKSSSSSPINAFSPEKLIKPMENRSSISSTIASFTTPKVNTTQSETSTSLSYPTNSNSGGGGGLRAHTSADTGIPLALRLLDLTIKFHDPQLSSHLEEGFIGPELYAVPWLSTGLARSNEIEVVWKLWDLLIAVNDPSFLPLLCIELLRHERDNILLKEPQDVLEIISKLKLDSLEVIDTLRKTSLETYELTPRGLRRPLRSICCYINIGNEYGDGVDDGDDDFYEDMDEFDHIAEEVEEVAAAVVAVARMPMNKAVDMLSKLDNAFSAAFSPEEGLKGGKEENNNESTDEEEEEEISLSINSKIKVVESPLPASKKQSNMTTPVKTPMKRGSFSNLITPSKSLSAKSLFSSTPNKSQNMTEKSSDKDTFKSPTAAPKKNPTLVRNPSSSSGISSNKNQIQAWSPKRISDLCNHGIFILSPNELVGSITKKRVKKNKTTSKDSGVTEGEGKGEKVADKEISGEGIETNKESKADVVVEPAVEMSSDRDGLLSWLVLDIRPKESTTQNQSLSLATSIQLPLEIIQTRKALDIWLQHFDSVKGAPICILDSNYSPQGNKSIWKKLGLGNSSRNSEGNNGNSGFSNNSNNTNNNSGGGGAGGKGNSVISPHAKWLGEVLVNEYGFPLVSVFGGSFTDLVEEVRKQQGGHLEPLIIDLSAGSVAGKGPITPDPKSRQKSTNNTGEVLNADVKRRGDGSRFMSEEEEKKLRVAVEEAEARGHDTVAKLIRRRLDGVTVTSTEADSDGNTSLKSKVGGRGVVVGALPRPSRSAKEEETLNIAEERGHLTVSSKLRETTSTPTKSSISKSLFPKNGRSNSIIEKMTKSGSNGWVDVDETEAERARSQTETTATAKSGFGALKSFVNRADEWVEKHMESLLDDTPTKESKRRMEEEGIDGGAISGDGDEWTEVDASMNADVAETLKTIQAAINPPSKK